MKQVSRQAKVGAIAVHNVTSILSRHMTTAECDVFGYLSIEDDLVLLVMPVVEEPTPLQVGETDFESQNHLKPFELSISRGFKHFFQVNKLRLNLI